MLLGVRVHEQRFEYEQLMLGLQKSINLNVVALKMVGDSKIVIWKVPNTINYLSLHLKSH